MAKEINIPITGDSSGYKKALGEAEDATGKFSKTTGAAGNALKAAFVGGAVVAGLHDVIDAASDYNETVSKTKVVLGTAADGAISFAEDAAESFGLSAQAALDAQSTFATFGKSAGLAGDELGTFSKDLTGLAADMALFSNTSPEQAIEAIGAALRGESEPIRAYGVLLDDATLRAEALSMGIYDGNGALNAQQKVLAAQAAIFKQTGDAQGDFARTSDGLAGQQKILSAEINNLKVTLGQKLIPVAIKTISTILDVGEAFSSLAFGTDLATESFKAFFEEADSHSIKEIGDTLKDMAEAADEAGGFIDRLWAFDGGDSRWGLLNESFKKMGDESPEALRKVYDELVKVRQAADDGDPAARKLADDYEITADNLNGLYDAYLAVTPAISETDRETRRLSAGSNSLVDALGDTEGAVEDVTETVDAFHQSLLDVEFAYDKLTGKLNEEDAWARVQESIMEFAANTEATAQDVRDLTRDLADYINETNLIPAEKKTLFLAELDEGKLAEVQRRLEIWARNNQINVNLIARGAPGFSSDPTFALGGTVPGRTGTPVRATVHAGETVRTPEQERALGDGGGGGGGPSIGEVHIHVQSMPTPNEMISIVKKYEARNGSGWRS